MFSTIENKILCDWLNPYQEEGIFHSRSSRNSPTRISKGLFVRPSSIIQSDEFVSHYSCSVPFLLTLLYTKPPLFSQYYPGTKLSNYIKNWYWSIYIKICHYLKSTQQSFCNWTNVYGNYYFPSNIFISSIIQDVWTAKNCFYVRYTYKDCQNKILL